MKIIDISVPIDENLPIWPDTKRFKVKKNISIDAGDDANDANIDMSVHTGTHVDAPLHFVVDGKSIDKIDPGIFVGPARVICLPKAKEITVKDLEKANIANDTERLLFKTTNSELYEKKVKEFDTNYVGINSGAAKWIVDKGIKLAGVDYLSAAKYTEAVEVHGILLRGGVVLLEGINLFDVEPGAYQLICLPIKISNLEAAPARAVLVK